MYQIDEKDRVVPLEGVPQGSVGSPRPFVIADEMTVVLAYYLEIQEIWERPESERGNAGGDEPFAIVLLKRCTAHMFGPPNDEAFAGHPLASRGLSPYGAYRIDRSSWIRQLERINSVHPRHQPERYRQLDHLVFAFHDSTFECVCQGFEARTSQGSAEAMIREMVRLFQQGF
jgi:hypothetical protein